MASTEIPSEYVPECRVYICTTTVVFDDKPSGHARLLFVAFLLHIGGGQGHCSNAREVHIRLTARQRVILKPIPNIFVVKLCSVHHPSCLTLLKPTYSY